MSKLKGILNAPLKNKLIELIRIRGALSVAEYMRIVLTNPESGFYMNKDVFGVKGHFTTSPEISQVFGEILGAWIVQEWRRFGSCKPLKLVEFGPGRGTLMSDIVRTIQKVHKHSADLQINLIEVSPHLKIIQGETIESSNPKLRNNIKWLNHVEEVELEEDGFSAFIAHEFLDALPVHKFIRDPSTNLWRELMIDYDRHENLRFCIAKQPTLATRLLVPENTPGNHMEVSPEAALVVEKVAKKINENGKGCMLICDYGVEDEDEHSREAHSSSRVSPGSAISKRDTFRAFKCHKSWPPLQDPGEADLTADVDFNYLKGYAEKLATVFGPVTQKDFLLRCGLELRLKSLRERAISKEDDDELVSGTQMLIDDMGSRYRFMSIFPRNTQKLFENNPPAGFSVGKEYESI